MDVGRKSFSEYLPADVLTEPAVTFPLRLVEELIAGRLLRKFRVLAAVLRDVGRFVSTQRRLHIDDPGRGVRRIVVAHLGERGVTRGIASAIRSQPLE